MRQPRILVLDARGATGLPYAGLVARLQPMELRVETAAAGIAAALARDAWDLGVITAREPGTAAELTAAVRAADAELPLVVIDAHPTVAAARQCLQAGVGDYLDLDRAESELEDALVRLLSAARRRAAEEVLRRAVERPYTFEGFLGESPAMRAVYSIIERVAASSVDVLVTGETGTGKELVARALHQRSRRAAAPFVPVDCGAIPDALMESEFFGHERGASFLTAHVQPDPVPRVIQRIQHREVAFPGNAEGRVDAVRHQRIDENAAGVGPCLFCGHGAGILWGNTARRGRRIISDGPIRCQQ